MKERKKDNMFPPEYVTYNSLTTTLNKEQICGDLALAEKIKEKGLGGIKNDKSIKKHELWRSNFIRRIKE